MKRDEAWDILCEFTNGERLRKHGMAVEAAMRAYLDWETALVPRVLRDGALSFATSPRA